MIQIFLISSAYYRCWNKIYKLAKYWKISSGIKQAEPLTYKDVELLWEQNVLGI